MGTLMLSGILISGVLMAVTVAMNAAGDTMLLKATRWAQRNGHGSLSGSLGQNRAAPDLGGIRCGRSASRPMRAISGSPAFCHHAISPKLKAAVRLAVPDKRAARRHPNGGFRVPVILSLTPVATVGLARGSADPVRDLVQGRTRHQNQRMV